MYMHSLVHTVLCQFIIKYFLFHYSKYLQGQTIPEQGVDISWMNLYKEVFLITWPASSASIT